MSLPVSLRTTLAHDMASGVWRGATLRFWEAKIEASATLVARWIVLRTLRQDWARGQWTPLTRQTLARLLDTPEATVVASLQQDFASGRWGPATLRAMEQL